MTSSGATSQLRKRRAAQATIWNAARQVGVDPLGRTQVLDLAAVAITRLAWRDSPIEDWHADPDSRISDPELMRANTATTRLVRRLLELQVPQAPDNPIDAVPWPGYAGADGLLASIRHALAAPDRRLPDARTVGELSPGGIELASYQDHVAQITRAWTNAASQLGTHPVLVLLAVTAASTCRDWWLAPGWPDLVAEFIACLKDPGRAANPTMTIHLRTQARPAQACDPDQLRQLLLTGPDPSGGNMTGPNPRAATPSGHTPQTVPPPRDAAHGLSPNPNPVPTQPTSEPLLLTVAQTAQRLGISRSLLYELLTSGEIESITIGRLRRIPVDALATYIEHQRAGDQDRRQT